MTHKGGARKGAGRKPALSTGERKHFYLAPDLVWWWGGLPERKKSELINKAIREMLTEKTAAPVDNNAVRDRIEEIIEKYCDGTYINGLKSANFSDQSIGIPQSCADEIITCVYGILDDMEKQEAAH